MNKLKEIVEKYSYELAMVLKYNPELIEDEESLQFVIQLRFNEALKKYQEELKTNPISVTDLTSIEEFKDMKKGLN